jgi:hypothetical protein
MAEGQKPLGRIEIKIGNLSFSAEGDQDWLSEQLGKVMLAATPAIAAEKSNDAPATGKAGLAAPSASSVGSLASYLKATGGESKQVQRFLATAGWLFRRGITNLTTAVVAAALAEHHQKRLSNPADCLNQNVSKGYCEKQKDSFFITPEGWNALGDGRSA